MGEALYLLDCYLKEFEAVVKSVKDDKFVVLDKTAFYPVSGGQPFDTGKIVRDGEEFPVVFVGKFGGEISHEVSKPGLKPGDKIKGFIDWERRYKHMRMHTGAHVVSIIIQREEGTKVTGNQLGFDRSRIDFCVETLDREKFKDYEKEANRIISRGLPVHLSIVPREEAEKLGSDLTSLAKGFTHDIKEIRLVDIEGFFKEACGGTHLKNTSEVKGVRFVKFDNKGKNNRRLYFELVD